MEPREILTVPIPQLDLSEGFCTTSALMGFKTLEDIVFVLPEQLIRKKGFSYSWLGELSAYLDKKGLLYLLQPLPGKSYD
ncbi:hypothetical protein ABIB62_004641 [Mucilaginibacter sp. UYP25]